MVTYPLSICELKVELEIVGPTLISWDQALSPKDRRSDHSFFAFTRDGTDRIFLPAGTLKGVFRHHAERFCRTLESTPIPLACNPLTVGSKAGYHLGCDQRLEGLPPHEQYRLSCPVCRMFGNRFLAGRLSFADAYLAHDIPITEGSLEIRGSMAQDRFTGSGLRSGIMKMECLNSRKFETRLILENYEIWQLGLLHFLLQSLADGQMQIGRRRSRGMGNIVGRVTDVHLKRMDRKGFSGEDLNYTVEGIGQLIPESEKLACGCEKNGILKNVRAFKDASVGKDAPVKFIIIRRPASITQFFKDAAAAWYVSQSGGPGSGFAITAQSLREQAAAVRGKEA